MTPRVLVTTISNGCQAMQREHSGAPQWSVLRRD